MLETRVPITLRWLRPHWPRFRRRPLFLPPSAPQPYYGPAEYASLKIFFSRTGQTTCLHPAAEPCCCTAWGPKGNAFLMRFRRRQLRPSYRQPRRCLPELPQLVHLKTMAGSRSKMQL
ncbi:hypothetical protein HPB50_010347 [Hyalomma asiaticum]|uniref:Uncharacterized protein n=1 Tax=Hyalomma asiaticum TaxID=266040 RepID=A0ACB7RZ59_HYAAI|nr:hypothetical protein HPB50_010347 [Hyalomma asiaticum]